MDEPVSFQVTDRKLEASSIELEPPRNPAERDAYLQGLQDAAIQVAYAFEGAGPIVTHIRSRRRALRESLR